VEECRCEFAGVGGGEEGVCGFVGSVGVGDVVHVTVTVYVSPDFGLACDPVKSLFKSASDNPWSRTVLQNTAFIVAGVQTPMGCVLSAPGGSPHRLLRKSIRGGDEMVGDEYENRDSQIGPGSVFFESPFIVYSIRISNNVSDAP
jgi:hypothetical protein